MSFLIVFLLSISAMATEPTARQAPTPQELFTLKQKSPFTFIEMGSFYGYSPSTKTCLFRSEDATILIHYCNRENIPARSLYVISEKWGVIQLYEEKFSDGTKRDFLIRVFASDLLPLLKKPLAQYSLEDLSQLQGQFAKNYPAACWATNRSLVDDKPGTACHNEDPAHFPEWSQASLLLTSQRELWSEYYAKMTPKNLTLR